VAFTQCRASLLTKKALPPDDWSRNLTKIFGTSAWESEFYAADSTPEFSLGFAETTQRNTDTAGVEKYILPKLGEVFHSVHSKPADEMTAYPISTRVNSPRNNDPAIIDRMD
jgi:hypothetical protein